MSSDNWQDANYLPQHHITYLILSIWKWVVYFGSCEAWKFSSSSLPNKHLIYQTILVRCENCIHPGRMTSYTMLSLLSHSTRSALLVVGPYGVFFHVATEMTCSNAARNTQFSLSSAHQQVIKARSRSHCHVEGLSEWSRRMYVSDYYGLETKSLVS